MTAIDVRTIAEIEIPTRWTPSVATRTTRAWNRLRWVDRVALFSLVGLTLVAIVGPSIAPYDPIERVGAAFLPPGSDGFLLGTDESGRDLLTRTLYGLRSTWFSTVVLIAATAIFGAIIGTIAGTVGGWVDGALMRVTDLILALPGPLMAIAIVAALGRSLTNTLIAIAICWWPWYARIVRNEVRALAARPHMEAARLAGASTRRLGLRHLFPGAVAPLVSTATLDVGTLVVTLTALTFLGLGAPPPAPELGTMIASGTPYLLEYWWLPIVPGVTITIMALVANLTGDAVTGLLGEER